jgi:hypothetical protein
MALARTVDDVAGACVGLYPLSQSQYMTPSAHGLDR